MWWKICNSGCKVGLVNKMMKGLRYSSNSVKMYPHHKFVPG